MGPRPGPGRYCYRRPAGRRRRAGVLLPAGGGAVRQGLTSACHPSSLRASTTVPSPPRPPPTTALQLATRTHTHAHTETRERRRCDALREM